MRVVLPEGVSTTIWRYGMFEEDVSYYLLALLRPADTFIDIGGHFGYFTMLGMELVSDTGTVITFEPMPATRNVLEYNIRTNAGPVRHHHLVPAAAGDQQGEIVFSDFGLLGSAFATSQTVRTDQFTQVGKVEVDVKTIDAVVDDLKLTDVRLIKIDAENAEYQVVMGALGTIERHRPAIILETGDEAGAAQSASRRVIDVLVGKAYAPCEFAEWRLRAHSLRQHYDYGNLLMVPEEMLADLESHMANNAGQAA